MNLNSNESKDVNRSILLFIIIVLVAVTFLFVLSKINKLECDVKKLKNELDYITHRIDK